MRNASPVNYRRPDIVNQLFLNQPLAIVDAVKYFTHGQRSSGVLPDEPETLLQLGAARQELDLPAKINDMVRGSSPDELPR
jgi:hypothetical protein